MKNDYVSRREHDDAQAAPTTPSPCTRWARRGSPDRAGGAAGAAELASRQHALDVASRGGGGARHRRRAAEGQQGQVTEKQAEVARCGGDAEARRRPSSRWGAAARLHGRPRARRRGGSPSARRAGAGGTTGQPLLAIVRCTRCGCSRTSRRPSSARASGHAGRRRDRRLPGQGLPRQGGLHQRGTGARSPCCLPRTPRVTG